MMRLKTIYAGLLAAVACLVFPGYTLAVPITVAFSGSVTDDPFLTGYLSFSGSYTFDSSATDAVAASDTGSYTSTGPSFGMTVDFDSGALIANAFGSINIGIANFGLVDQFTVTAIDGATTLELFLEDSDASAFASDAMPATVPPFADFEVRQFRWFYDDVDSPGEIIGTLDSLSCTAGCGGGGNVPEPPVGALIAAALLALAASRRRTH